MKSTLNAFVLCLALAGCATDVQSSASAAGESSEPPSLAEQRQCASDAERLFDSMSRTVRLIKVGTGVVNGRCLLRVTRRGETRDIYDDEQLWDVYANRKVLPIAVMDGETPVNEDSARNLQEIERLLPRYARITE